MNRIFGMAFLALSLASCGGGGEQSSVRDEVDAIEGPKVSKGQTLFQSNCIQCHNVKTDKIGPKLEGALARWNNDTAGMYSFIKNAPAFIKSGHPRAVAVYEEWNKTMMTPMPHLTDSDIDEILNYIEGRGE